MGIQAIDYKIIYWLQTILFYIKIRVTAVVSRFRITLLEEVGPQGAEVFALDRQFT